MAGIGKSAKAAVAKARGAVPTNAPSCATARRHCFGAVPLARPPPARGIKVSSLTRRIAPRTRTSRSQPGQKLGLLGGKLLWRQNALLVQVCQPFDLGENVTLLGSRGREGARRGSGALLGSPFIETMGNCEMLTVPCWLVKGERAPTSLLLRDAADLVVKRDE
jgi:hypothetical protein